MFDHASRRNTDGKNGNVITNSAEHGLIPQRDFFDKDIAVEGNTSNYYIIKKGDFVYNPRKSTTAPYGPFNCYGLEDEGIVSPLYTCLTPKHEEFTEYLLWYFKSPAWYSYIYHNGAQGGARHDRVGMTNDLMDGIPVNLPCLREQEKVSKYLSILDCRITVQRKLVESLKSYKRGLIQGIFSATQKDWFNDGTWHKEQIKNLLQYEQPQKYIVNSEVYNPTYTTPVLTANKAFILGYTNEKTGIYDRGDVIIYDDFTMDIKYVTFPFKVKSSTIKMLTPKSEVDLFFMFCLLQSLNLTPEGHQRSYISQVEVMEVSIPCYATQTKIASFLMIFNDDIKREEERLNALTALKKGLFQAMFI